MEKTRESVISWSLITEMPVLCYIPSIDEYVVYWDGFAMSRSSAMVIALEAFGIYHGPAVYSEVNSEFRRIYAAGAFGNVQWDNVVKNVLHYHRKQRTTHAQELAKKYKVYEVFSCFTAENAIIIAEEDPF